MAKIDASLKSMGSYELFAWGDACSVAAMLCEDHSAERAREIFLAIPVEKVREFEVQCRPFIYEFIKKTESARRPYFAKIMKNSDDLTKVSFLTLSVIALMRIKYTIGLRDSYREALAPGLPNRVTTGGLYSFCNQLHDAFNYEWPSEVFEAICAD